MIPFLPEVGGPEQQEQGPGEDQAAEDVPDPGTAVGGALEGPTQQSPGLHEGDHHLEPEE